MELIDSHLAFSEFVKVEEELLDSHALHYHSGLKSQLDVVGIVRNFDSLLQVAVLNQIEVGSLSSEESATCVSELALTEAWSSLGMLGHVRLEQVFGLVDVCAKLDVVDLPDVAFVEVFANQDLEQVLRRWQEVAFLEHSSELLGCDVAVLRLIEILELRLDQDSVVFNLQSHGHKQVTQLLLLSLTEFSR